MEPEPLKGKLRNYRTFSPITGTDKCVKEEDVKAAVEWYEQELSKLMDESTNGHYKTGIADALLKITKAFPDLK